MKKTITFTYLELLTLLIVTGLTITLLMTIPQIVSYISDSGKDRLNAIIGSIGNISGGLIGGIVAYIVAAYQVSKSTEHIRQSSLKQTYVNLQLLLDEIEYNQKVFQSSNSSVDLQTKVNHLQKQLINEQWNKVSPSFADNIDNTNFKYLCNLYRNIHFFQTGSSALNQEFIDTNITLIEKIRSNTKTVLDDIFKEIL